MKAIIVSLFLILPLGIFASEDILGFWVVPGGGAVVVISQDPTGARMTVVRTLDPRLLDQHNPDQQQRNQPLQGQTLGQGFVQNGDVWEKGELYDPDSGRVYKANIRLLDHDHLLVRGYIGLPVLGRSQTWMSLALYRQQVIHMLAINEQGQL